MSDKSTASRQPITPGVARTGSDRVDSRGFTVGLQATWCLGEKQMLLYDVRWRKSSTFTSASQVHNFHLHSDTEMCACCSGESSRKACTALSWPCTQLGQKAECDKEMQDLGSESTNNVILLLSNQSRLGNATRSANGHSAEEQTHAETQLCI